MGGRNHDVINSTFIRNDGGGYCACFFGESLNITNSRFEDNYANYSAVFMVNTYLNLTNSTFINNTATNTEGGVFEARSYGSNSVCYLDNNKFINNSAHTYGGVINALFNVKMNLTNNVFIGNHAGKDGGAIYAFHRSHINSSNNLFQENYADELGGAIYTYSGYNILTTLNSTNNTYDKNHARQGGAIFTGYGSIVNSTRDIYSNNTADELGGALVGGSESSIINIEETNFTENKAVKGGAICGLTPTKINNTNFTDNSASFGGAVEAIGTMKISNSTFTNNTAFDDGGAVYGRTGSNVEISNTSFTENSAISFGGAISANKNTDFSVSNNNFVNNTARYAGAVYGYLESTIDIQNSNFTENSANNGGAIGTNGTVTISYSNFTGNYANDTGGAIECESDLARLTVQVSNFTDNYVKSNDGYVVDFSKSKYVVIKENTFKNNTDDNRDMLFSEVNNLAISDINGNDYVDNYLKTTITPLGDVEITHKDDITFNYPVNVTLRSVYNHTINTGSVVYEYNDISNSSDVKNNQSDISVHNKDLQLPVNIVNYEYQSLNKNYQSSNDKFNINKLISTRLNMQLEPQDKVNVGETVKVTITLEDIDGTRLADREIEVEVNGISYDLGDNNKTDVNGQLIFDYLVESFTINNIPGEIVFTAKHLETHPESYYDSAENIEKSIRINEIPTHIHIDYNNDDVREGNTFNVTVILCSDEISHEHIVGELVYYNITSIDGTRIISGGNFRSTEEGYNITIESLPEQGYMVFASFDGSDLYDKSAEETDIIPNYIGTEVEIIIPTGNVYVNQTKTITIMLEDSSENPLPDDHVVFVTINNGEEIRVPVVSGVGTFDYASNISTEIDITARFNKTNIYSGSRGNGTYHVLELPTHTTLELINDKVGNTTIKATVQDTINDKTVNDGNVTITLPDGRNITEKIENGEAIFHITTIMEGEYDLEAKFNGIDLVYTPSDQNTHRINIIKTPTETIMQDMTVMVTEKTITINVEVKDENKQNITSGTVLITVNEETIPAPINDGKANITINNLPKGKYTINATYTGNGTYETSNATATLNVLPEPTKSQVEILDTTLGNVTIKVTVTDLNDNKVTIGNVTLMDGQGLIIPEQKEIKLTNGEAIIKIPATTTGLTKIKVRYNENEIYGESEAVDEDGNNPINIDVTRIPTITEIETLNATFSNVKIRVTVTNKTGDKVPEGMVIIRYGNGGTNATEIRNGIAEFNIPAENVGRIIVRAQYDGTEKYLQSRARNESLPIGDLDEYDYIIEVTPLETQITATAKNGTNTKTSVDVTLKDEQGRELANAPVTIKTLDGTQVANGITNSKGQVDIPVKLSVGNTTLRVEFAGNSTHIASNTTTTINTLPHNNTINIKDNNETLNINLTDDDNNPVPNMPITITLPNGTIITTGTTNENGTTNITIPLPPGTYDLNISTPGDENNNPANTTTTITIPKIPTQITATPNNGTNTKTNLDITLTDENNNPIGNATIIITDKNGKEVETGTTNKDGKVNIPLKLPTGTTELTITYPGNSTYLTSNTTTTINTLPHNNTINIKDNNETLNINLTDDDNNPVPNMPITITLPNGTIITTGTTNENGTTNITIPLEPGDYTINITTPGNEENNPANKTIPISIPPKNTEMDVKVNNGTQPTVDVKLTDENGNPIGGAPITIKDKNGKIIGNETTRPDGTVNIPIDIPVGIHDITVSYPGNRTYKPTNKTAPARKDKQKTVMDVAASPNGTVKVKITDENGKAIPELPVNITDEKGNIIGKGTTDKDGIVTAQTNLTPGPHNITVATPGNENNTPANKTVPLVIPPKDTKLNTTVLDPIRANTTIKVNLTDKDNNAIPNAPITVTLPNGTQIPTTTNADGTVEIPLNLPVGNNQIKIDYPGNQTYKPANQTIPVNVQKTPTTTTISILNNTAGNVKVTGTVKDKYGQNVPEGTVTIKSGNNTVGTGTVTNGVYTITTNMASKGTYTLKAEFAETSNYLSSSSTTTVTVNPKTPTLTVQPVGTNVGNTSIIATLKDPEGKPIGNAPITVTLPNGTKITGTTNNNGVLNIPIDLREGNNNLTINYPGNATYNPVTTNTNMKVSKNNPIIKLDPVRGVIGEDIILTAYLTGVNGEKITGGNLVFKLNGKSLRNDGRFDSNDPAMKLSVKDGKVTITLKADLYLRNAKNLTASYSGNYKYKETNSPTVEAQIQKRYANLTVTATPSKQKQYQTITFTATVKDTTRNGKNTTLINQNTSVMFKVNGNTLKDAKGQIIYVPVGKDLKASYNYIIPAGTGGITASKAIRDYNVDAIFTGINYYPGSRNTTKFNVERSPVTINIAQAKVSNSNILSLQATIKDYKANNVIGTNKYTIKVNGKSYTDKNGKPVYWNAKNGIINLSGIQIDPKTTIKRVMVVTGERQAYMEGRNETTNIIRV